MMTYSILGEDQESIDELLEDEALEVEYRSRHLPLLYVKSEEPIEELRGRLKGYEINEENIYRILQEDKDEGQH